MNSCPILTNDLRKSHLPGSFQERLPHCWGDMKQWPLPIHSMFLAQCDPSCCGSYLGTIRGIRLRSQSTNGRDWAKRSQRSKAKAQSFCFWTFYYIGKYFPYYGSQSKVRSLFWTSPNILTDAFSTHAIYVWYLVHIHSPSLVALNLPTQGFLTLCRV